MGFNQSVRRTGRQGFTLAELLIALAILGVIATFTIPKVLQGQTSSRRIAVTKEAAAMFVGALQAYKLNSGAVDNTGLQDLTQYMNYVKLDTSSPFAEIEGSTTNCSASTPCLILHNGAAVYFGIVDRFGSGGPDQALNYYINPDGIPDSKVCTSFALHANGRIVDQGGGFSADAPGGWSPGWCNQGFTFNWN